MYRYMASRYALKKLKKKEIETLSDHKHIIT